MQKIEGFGATTEPVCSKKEGASLNLVNTEVMSAFGEVGNKNLPSAIQKESTEMPKDNPQDCLGDKAVLCDDTVEQTQVTQVATANEVCDSTMELPQFINSKETTQSSSTNRNDSAKDIHVANNSDESVCRDTSYKTDSDSSLEQLKTELKSELGGTPSEPMQFSFPLNDGDDEDEFEKIVDPDENVGGTDTVVVQRENMESDATNTENSVPTANQVYDEEQKVPIASQYDIFSKDFSISATIFDICGKLFTTMKERKLVKTFLQNGRLIKSGDFYFYLYQKQLMLFQYCGSDMRVEIPAFVGNLPVTVLHQDFLNGGAGVFSDHRLRGLKNAFSFENLTGLDTSFDTAFKEIVGGVLEVKLPNTLKVIVGKPFWGCKKLQALILPESLASCASKFYDGSGIRMLFFNGSIPENLDIASFAGSVYRRVN